MIEIKIYMILENNLLPGDTFSPTWTDELMYTGNKCLQSFGRMGMITTHIFHSLPIVHLFESCFTQLQGKLGSVVFSRKL